MPRFISNHYTVGPPCRATFVDYDGSRHPDNPAVKIDENTYVFGIHRNGYFVMVAVDLTGSKIQDRWVAGDAGAVTIQIWNSGSSGGSGGGYLAEDVSFDCGRIIFESH